MTVSNDTIIDKMFHELQTARNKQENQDTMIKHIEHVRLLCELMIEESNHSSIKKEQLNIENQSDKRVNSIRQMDHGNANGESIFDF